MTRLTHTPPLVAESQGNMQALANGDWFVGWGQEPYFSEFSPEGQLLFDAHFPAHEESYRDFRFAVDGHACAPSGVRVPARRAAARGPSTRAGTARRSWPRGGCWRAPAREPADDRAGSRSGFETAIAIPENTVGPDVEVQALGAAGQVLGSSAAVSESGL